MKLYEGIIFDWDGTAVYSRKAPAEEACECIGALLDLGVVMVIISGTTYENIAGGRLHDMLRGRALENLYLGLGRGVYNIGFREGQPVVLENRLPTPERKLAIDAAAFEVHKELYRRYHLATDIVFSRPNYCKIDLMVDYDRGDQLFLQMSEVEQVNRVLTAHGIAGGLLELIRLSDEIGRSQGLDTVTTTDAKYLEVGLTTKSHNVNYMAEKVLKARGISMVQCTCWGDEFVYLTQGVKGSDAYMITEGTRGADFFDVSAHESHLPEEVTSLGGGVETFLGFLRAQEKGRGK